LTTIFQAVTIGSVTIPNRIVLSPINTSFGDIAGKTTKRLVDFHAKIAKGRIGLSIVGSTAVNKSGKVNFKGLLLDDEERLDNFSKLFLAIENAGSIPAIQLMHAGRQTYPEVTGSKVLAPSNVPSPFFNVVPTPLEKSDIKETINDFSKSALIAKKAGAKIIELHGAHGYLIEQFLSPSANKREDEYGGKLENRVRFFVQVIKAVKSKLGRDFPIICRIGVDDYKHARIKQEESMTIASLLEEAGADCISISAGIYGQRDKIYPSSLMDCRARLRVSGRMKQKLDIPIIYGGAISRLEEAEEILDAKQADLVGFARGIVADPELIVKGKNAETIAYCTRCNYCAYNFRNNETLRCTMNANL
jgi:2,4-dienoyl-CoA reductase-like NADH-dependent reductase (Old Yellow Enzyme family)